MSFQMLKAKRQSKPGSPLRAQILSTSFGCRVPRSGQDWLPVSETSLHPCRSTTAFVRFWISTYSIGLLTSMIRTEPPVVGMTGGCDAVTGGFVAVSVGSAVPVAVGEIGVGEAVTVACDVSVGSAVAKGCVGNGVSVGKSKSNKGVGVAPPSWLGKSTGLGSAVAGSRPVKDGRLTRSGQMQQNGSTSRKTKSILPVDPCWL